MLVLAENLSKVSFFVELHYFEFIGSFQKSGCFKEILYTVEVKRKGKGNVSSKSSQLYAVIMQNHRML